jgi:hypothetical protein
MFRQSQVHPQGCILDKKIKLAKREEKVGEEVRDTRFEGGKETFSSRFEGSQAVPAFPSGR